MQLKLCNSNCATQIVQLKFLSKINKIINSDSSNSDSSDSNSSDSSDSDSSDSDSSKLC